MHLEHFIIDLSNKVAYRKNDTLPKLLLLSKTLNNDRSRSELTGRKPFDLATAFQINYDSSIFAKRATEFAKMWVKDNGKFYPSAREVFVGVWLFFTSQLDSQVSAADRASGSFHLTLTTY